ncbi:MAG: hypothetical protein KKG33_05685, partial [candidate division Zixibacteria bacterium]|nr:hypothetical protein [candidate division Zixibacteria bacterium]MBU2625033.1 hypothetical protein [candidate division Zixibacteria bacterium]
MKRTLAICTVFIIAVVRITETTAGEYPFYGYGHPASNGTPSDSIGIFDSILVDLGINNVIVGFQPLSLREELDTARNHGINFVVQASVPIGAKEPAYHDSVDTILEILATRGIYSPMDVVHQDVYEGYYFDLLSVGQSFVDQALDFKTVRRCQVSQDTAGYVFLEGPSWQSYSYHSAFAQMVDKGRCGAWDDTITARFNMKITGEHDDTVSVCRVTAVWKYRPDTDWDAQDSAIVAEKLIRVSDFDTTGAYVDIDFPFSNGKFTSQYSLYVELQLYWYDAVDLCINQVTILNEDGRYFWDHASDAAESLSSYFTALYDYSNVKGYHLCDEAAGIQYPILRVANDAIKGITSSATDTVRVVSPATANLGTRLNGDVLCRYVDVAFLQVHDYFFRCGANNNSDEFEECRGWWDSIGVQHTLTTIFDRVDILREKAHDAYKNFWLTLSTGQRWSDITKAYCYQAPYTDSFYYYRRWPSDLTLEDHRVQVYMALAHGVDGIGYWRMIPIYWPSSPQHNPEDEEPGPFFSYAPHNDTLISIDNNCPDEGYHRPFSVYCEKEDTCFYVTYDKQGYPDEGDGIKLHGLFERHPDSTYWCLSPEGEWVKEILGRAKPIGSILKECSLLEVGLVDDQGIGFVDSVVGEFRDPVTGTEDWIEAAVFEDNQTGDDYFMLVNRRLLASEGNDVTVYLDEMQLSGDWNYLVIDQSSDDSILVNADSNFAFHAHLQPGEGYLYEIVPAGVCGYLSGTISEDLLVCGDIIVDEDDTLHLHSDWISLEVDFSQIDFTSSGVDTVRPEIIVKGTLILEDSVVFSSPSEEAGSWYGIRIVDNGRVEVTGDVRPSLSLRDAYIGMSFEAPTTSGSFALSFSGLFSECSSVIENCQAGGIYLNTDNVTFADTTVNYHVPLIIRDVPDGYGIKVDGNCPDFDWMVQIQDCKYGIYIAAPGDTVQHIRVLSSEVNDNFGIYTYSTSTSSVISLERVLLEGDFNTGISATYKSNVHMDTCMIVSHDSNTVVGINVPGMSKVTMRNSGIQWAKTGIYTAQGGSDFGGAPDSLRGGNLIVIDLADTASRSINHAGIGTLPAYGNYWGGENGDNFRFQTNPPFGSIGYDPWLDEEPNLGWSCG